MSVFELDEREREFLDDLARHYGLPDLSEDTLMRALGFDRFTDEWAEEFGKRLRSGRDGVDLITVSQEKPNPISVVQGLLGGVTSSKS